MPPQVPGGLVSGLAQWTLERSLVAVEARMTNKSMLCCESVLTFCTFEWARSVAEMSIFVFPQCSYQFGRKGALCTLERFHVRMSEFMSAQTPRRGKSLVTCITFVWTRYVSFVIPQVSLQEALHA